MRRAAFSFKTLDVQLQVPVKSVAPTAAEPAKTSCTMFKTAAAVINLAALGQLVAVVSALTCRTTPRIAGVAVEPVPGESRARRALAYVQRVSMTVQVLVSMLRMILEIVDLA